jgi:hypothetical protein
MKYNILAEKAQSTYWDNHYFVFYFIYSLYIEENLQTRRTILVKIAENIEFLNNFAKSKVFPIFLMCSLLYYHGAKRKKNYLILKWGFRYLEKR